MHAPGDGRRLDLRLGRSLGARLRVHGRADPSGSGPRGEAVTRGDRTASTEGGGDGERRGGERDQGGTSAHGGLRLSALTVRSYS
ncbi:hypothetical protein GCM10010972_21310 [Cellulomonas carbonis]|uniref:Uncharacterized protein n=1 Tax=Cellulomonas carbonis T26 TaxID=947969 RepID=A0A0A0BU93_9CELL|nr:hypothetical protein N868_14025 [Cellulomonas carbonis T26]GGC07770.1 hypothetical protein GCM10010972_21310 [Cellulomonas carbonis]